MLFTTANMAGANKWSQYVDLGHALGYGSPVGWFANAVAILPDTTAGGIASMHDVTPVCLVVTLQMEWEVAAGGSWISPHFGEFQVAP